MSRPGAGGVTGRTALSLVARREITERIRTKSFKVTTAITLLLVVAAIVAPKLIGDETPKYHVAFVGDPSELVVASVQSIGESVGADIVVKPPVTRDEGTALLLADELDVLVTEVDLLVKEQQSEDDLSTRARFTNAVAAVVALQYGLADAGVPSAAVQRALSSPPLQVRGLLAAKPDRSSERATATVGMLLTFAFLSFYGSWIVVGVVEEKSSRVVEVLLATVRAKELLVGKVLGIGVVALIQGGLVVTTALVVSTATGSNVLRGAGGAVLVQAFVWFLLGYATYALLFAAAGSLVSRTEEAQNVAFPIMVPLYASYIITFTALSGNESSTLIKVLSWIPVSAPLAMPVRSAVGDAVVLDIAGSMLLTVITIVFLSSLAGSVYERHILRTGGRIRWRDALRPGKDPVTDGPARP